MAELVDALASGASGLTAVEVRVLFWAPSFETASSERAAPFLFFGPTIAGAAGDGLRADWPYRVARGETLLEGRFVGLSRPALRNAT